MSQMVLYLGDTQLSQAASYLAGVMAYYRICFDYHASDELFNDAWLTERTGLLILSDYPASNLTTLQLETIARRVKQGMSLLMIGGWESFSGLAGGYQKSILRDVLPVVLQEDDDRIHLWGPCLAVRNINHPIVEGLPFDEQTPVIGGLNGFTAKPGTVTILSADLFKASRRQEHVQFERGLTWPLLVTGRYEKGRTAAFACDAAPHWVGPFVDWGTRRIQACACGGMNIEVGQWYAEFFKNLIVWLLDTTSAD